jgi:cold shock CspA family protein
MANHKNGSRQQTARFTGSMFHVERRNRYGFLSIHGSSGTIFFHSNELLNASMSDLKKGDVLEFEYGQSCGRLCAVRVLRREQFNSSALEALGGSGAANSTAAAK